MDKYFEDSYRRKCRKDLANYFYQNINDPTGQYNHIWAFVIKAFHFTVPIYACLIYLCGPLWLGLITLFLSLCSWSLFMYLKGCFVSNVEYKLNSDNFINIIDPYLVMSGYPITEETRYKGTQYIVLIHFIIAFAILYFRLKMRHFTKN
jgi:hypothetical protein